MNASKKRAFYYHAGANALGGFLKHPVARAVATSGSVSLSPAGGFMNTRVDRMHVDGLVSFEGAQVSVSGTEYQEGGWRTVATAIVEGLNLFEVVTADRLVGQISVVHPPDDGPSIVSLNGTKFVNLRVNGEIVQPILERRLLVGRPPIEGTRPSPMNGVPFSDLLWVAGEQYVALKKSGIEALGPRFALTDPEADLVRRGSALCSLVQGVEVQAPAQAYCHVIHVPDFGNIFLGELLVTRFSAQMTMVRVEMGSLADGTMTSCTVESNGSTMP